MKPRVIVVDDNPDTVAVLSEFLNINDIEVVGLGYNGLEAVKLYKRLKPDVVLLDLHMEEYGGIFALKKIHKLNHKAKVIMVTADGYIDTREDLEHLGASAIINKAKEMDYLPEEINKLCKKRNFGGIMNVFGKNKVKDI